MPENRCSNCVTYNYECTYIEAAKVSPNFYFHLKVKLMHRTRNGVRPKGVCDPHIC